MVVAFGSLDGVISSVTIPMSLTLILVYYITQFASNVRVLNEILKCDYSNTEVSRSAFRYLLHEKLHVFTVGVKQNNFRFKLCYLLHCFRDQWFVKNLHEIHGEL